ncbi:hypothetical protein [Larkinella soli]|uniref:hypothetical protein n=1 Tax=Larkinella soli TaxID=1770527 RepID=UPI000FFB1CD3|nr:hypothetical protein [Larkinella soli]
MRLTARITDGEKTLHLTFGTYAAKRFCDLMECSADELDMLTQFSGRNLHRAMVAMMQAGAEHAAMAMDSNVRLTEFEACEWIDAADKEGQGKAIRDAFCASILNIHPDKVDEWFAGLNDRVAEANAALEEAKKKAQDGTSPSPGES